MKKAVIYYFTLLLFLLAVSIFLISCNSVKKSVASDTTIITSTTNKDSIKTLIINQAINDKLITPVLQSNTGKRVFDSLVNAKVDEILSKLNTSKSSGDNSYQLFYNQIKKQLEFYSKIAQTKNENLSTNNNKIKTLIRIKKIPVIVEKPRSKLVNFFLLMGLIFVFFIGYKVVVFVRKKTSIFA